VSVTVADSGPGIPAAQIEQIFAPFFTSKPDGLGLGLNICRTIVEAHGGRITVENAPLAGQPLPLPYRLHHERNAAHPVCCRR
jgi:signal transduction histidine kinase